MERENNRHLVLVSLMIVVGLSAYLRLLGITWGLNSGYGHYVNYHPDEFISIRGILPIDLRAGKLQAPDAYFEGTFNYYLWAVPKTLYQLRSDAPLVIDQNTPTEQFKFVLFSGRLMSVAFDLTTVVLLFVIVTEVTRQAVAGILAALIYGVIPMQVIYSHFMRTYALSNLLCVLVIWLSLKAVRHGRWWLFVITGMSAGLAAATRYPACLILTVPCLLMLFRSATSGPWHERVRKSFVCLLSGPLWLLGMGFVFGLFIGEPMLFFDSKNLVREILFEMSHYAPAGARNPFDLAPVWRYLSVLIPYATYPLLWLLLYVSTLYVIFRPFLWPTVVPLLLFAACYTYGMAKGYIDVFARLVMLIFPVLCIFAGLAVADIAPKLRKRPVLFSVVTALSLLLITPTIVFDCAYGLAMRRKDAREMLIDDMRELTKNRSSTTIGVSEGGGYFYTAMPAVFPLKSNNVAVELETSLTAPADFFVMGFERPLDHDSRKSKISEMESNGVYRLIKVYSPVPTVFGKRLDLSDFPPDMTYPFPTILLFRNLAQP
jgi:hypothetical protein